MPILRFLLLFRGILALLKHKIEYCDKKSLSSEVVCAFGGWAFLLLLNLWLSLDLWSKLNYSLRTAEVVAIGGLVLTNANYQFEIKL